MESWQLTRVPTVIAGKSTRGIRQQGWPTRSLGTGLANWRGHTRKSTALPSGTTGILSSVRESAPWVHLHEHWEGSGSVAKKHGLWIFQRAVQDPKGSLTARLNPLLVKRFKKRPGNSLTA